jgi:hypothetical protein
MKVRLHIERILVTPPNLSKRERDKKSRYIITRSSKKGGGASPPIINHKIYRPSGR